MSKNNCAPSSQHLAATRFLGFTALNECCFIQVGAFRSGDEVRHFIQLHRHYSGWRCEGFWVSITGQGCRLLHEHTPDRSGGMCAFALEVAVVVKADPNHAKQVGGIARTPPAT